MIVRLSKKGYKKNIGLILKDVDETIIKIFMRINENEEKIQLDHIFN